VISVLSCLSWQGFLLLDGPPADPAPVPWRQVTEVGPVWTDTYRPGDDDPTPVLAAGAWRPAPSARPCRGSPPSTRSSPRTHESQARALESSASPAHGGRGDCSWRADRVPVRFSGQSNRPGRRSARSTSALPKAVRGEAASQRLSFMALPWRCCKGPARWGRSTGSRRSRENLRPAGTRRSARRPSP
jgi:hypothetical protein